MLDTEIHQFSMVGIVSQRDVEIEALTWSGRRCGARRFLLDGDEERPAGDTCRLAGAAFFIGAGNPALILSLPLRLADVTTGTCSDEHLE